MKSNYKKLGQFIRDVSVKNKDLNVELLLGVSITKKFIVSIANTVGTDMSKYKIVKRHQFAYGPVTSRNGEKISVALLNEDECLVSTSYTVFDIVDTEKLDPEYLMMWFRRSEFDRYARFMSHGTVRELFGWAEMCDIELPIPSIQEQRKIVREYNVVNDRISLNQKLTNKLEDTAQAIYKEWFVNFEFPISKQYAESINKPELEGKPYMSSSGEMKYCDELKCDIPKHWSLDSLSNTCSIGSSKRVFQNEYIKKGVPFYRGKEVTLRQNGQLIDDPLFISEARFEELDSKFGSPQKGDILITAVGTIGSTYLVKGEKFYFKDGNIIWLKDFLSEKSSIYIFDFMQSQMFLDYINDITIGSTQSAITINALSICPILLPDEQILLKYCEMSGRLKSYYESVIEEKTSLAILKSIILAKISKLTV